MTDSPRASVVVPTFDRPGLLARCLAALCAQQWTGDRFEVIVVDDGHAAEVRTIVKAASHPCADFRCERTPRRASGPAAARNVGWRSARAPLVAFTDDDCIPQPGWLAAGMRSLETGAAGAWGHVIVPLGPYPTDHEVEAAGLEESPFAAASCFYRKDALAQVDGFDERFTMPWREDRDLHFTLLERGMTLVRAPEEAVVIHPVRPAPWGISLRQQRKTQFEPLLYSKHPALYRLHVRPDPDWSCYATLAAALAAAGAIALDLGGLSLAATGVWGLLTARFCALRLEGTSRTVRHRMEMAFTSTLIPPLSIFWRLVGAVRFRAFLP
ncbi:MAG: glycosyltransferase family 2 protein [Candidatus Polarisedimenticolia bacterium]